MAKRSVTRQPTDRQQVDNILSMWDEKPREAANAIVEKYGPPDEATVSRLIWHDNGPWKRTIVYREEVPHHFPKRHTDVVEQFVDYKVPIGKFDDLARFDGSVIPERTKGEISARCDKEMANFLALNLADDIVRGRTTPDEARKTYTEKLMKAMMGQKDDYTEGLRFTPEAGRTGDPDEGTITETMMEKMKEKLSGS